MVFAVRGGLRFGPIEQLLNPLTNSFWLMILVQCIFGLIFIEIVERMRRPALRDLIFGSDNRHPMWALLIMLMGVGAIEPMTNFARFLFMAWVLWTFQLRNAYTAKMYDSLRYAKRVPVPATMDELVDQDYILITEFSNEFYPRNKIRFQPMKETQLYDLNGSEERITIMALLDNLMDFNVRNAANSTLAYVAQQIYDYPIVMFFKKHSILLSTFNPLLKRLNYAGITAAIADRNRRWESDTFEPAGAVVEELKNEHLYGIYYICGVMYLMCLVVFILELVAKKSKRLLSIMEWLH